MGLGLGERVADLTVREIAHAAEAVLGRPTHVTRETDIARDLAIDSLALMNIVMELEDKFDVSIPLDRMAVIETVGELASLIDELRAKR